MCEHATTQPGGQHQAVPMIGSEPIKYPCLLCQKRPQTRYCRGLCRACHETFRKMGLKTKRCGVCHSWKFRSEYRLQPVGHKYAPFCKECEAATK